VAPPELAFSDFLTKVEASQVAEVRFADGGIDLVLKDGNLAHTVPPPGFLTTGVFVSDLAHRGVRIDVDATPEPGTLSGSSLALAAAFLALLGFTVYRTTAGRIHTPGRAKLAERGDQVVTFQDVAGVDEAKDEVKEIVDFLRQPERFAAIGGRIPKGVLLIGPPGTGKTLLARSIAGEAGVPFLFASGSDFVEMYAGVGAARVRRLFKDARRHTSCIIFIDELDAVGRSRGGSSLSHEEREQTLNQLLVEMDGFEATRGIVVIAATNRQDILDPALLRPGRFDRQVMVGNPDLKGREAILGVHSRKTSLASDVNLRSIARGTPGFSGADLANLVNEAALLAARADRAEVRHSDMEAARDQVLMGVERRSVVLSELDRVNCAYHEAGHAVVAALVPMADPLHKVTIIPRGRAMGVTMQLPEADRHTYTTGYLEAQIAVLMGGRVAEELFMNHMTSGASNDIERATDIAQHMVCEWGMSSLGMRAFRKAGNAYDGDKPHAMSEALARRVDEEIEKALSAGYDRAWDLLNRNRETVKALAEALLDQEALDADELKALIVRTGARS
jgi:cell division protease FtsH